MSPNHLQPARWLALALCAATTGAAAQVTTSYEYDPLGRPTARIDGLGLRSTQTLDALGRIVTQTNPLSETTGFAYNGGDALVEAQAANGALTAYAVNGLGQVRQEASPDRGTLTYTYDAAGNAVLVRDARGAQIETNFDALNRPLTRAFRTPAGAIEATHSYVWDTAPHGLGRLARLDADSVALDYVYDASGRIATKIQTAGASVASVGYEHDPATGRLAAIQYPSGRRLALTYDAAGRVAALTWDTVPIASNLAWHPFGGVASVTLANGLVHRRDENTAGQLVAFSLGGQLVEVGYDAAGRVTGFSHVVAPALDQGFSYDAADRLTGYQDAARAISYTYDANGNRLGQIVGATSTAYAYAPGTNRLTQIGTVPMALDAAGNRTGDGALTYTYDATGRLVTAGTAQYQYNGLGERAAKTNGTAFTHYVYDESGKLLGEYDAAGQPLREYAWLGAMPVAVLDYATPGTPALYAVETDHLVTPRLVTDASGQPRWRWLSAPFGDTPPEQSPAGLAPFVLNLRFPGQYFDAESGLHYNYFRDYEPDTGRYVQSDPIGLAGGINTYTYVGGNPISFTDPMGLQYQGFPSSSPIQVVTNPAWQNVFNNVGNLPVPAPSLPGDYPGVNVPPSVPFVPAPGKPVCTLVCPNDGDQCRPAPTNGWPSIRNPGCYEVCYETAVSPWK